MLVSRRWSKSLSKLPVLSIRQPFAWPAVNGIKDIENRSMRTHHRGPLLIHASKSRAALDPGSLRYWSKLAKVALPENYEFGGVIGMVQLVDCVKQHPSV